MKITRSGSPRSENGLSYSENRLLRSETVDRTAPVPKCNPPRRAGLENEERSVLAEIPNTSQVTCHTSLALSSTLEAGFGEIDITLDAAEDFVVDGFFVAEGDDGLAFCFQGFTGQLLEVA